jgi:hypothetical protein
MKLAIQRRVGNPVAGLVGLAHLADDLAHPGGQLRAMVLHGRRCGSDLENLAQLADHADLVGAKAEHVRTPLRQHIHQPFYSQSQQRFPHRCLGDAKLGCECVFR